MASFVERKKNTTQITFCSFTQENGEDKSPNTPVSTSKEIHNLRDQLEQQAIQTRQALSQLMLVREQLISETNARIEAQVCRTYNIFRIVCGNNIEKRNSTRKFLSIILQARTQQLLQQNRELLEHLASLGGYTYTENERASLTSANIGLAPQVHFFFLLQNNRINR